MEDIDIERYRHKLTFDWYQSLERVKRDYDNPEYSRIKIDLIKQDIKKAEESIEYYTVLKEYSQNRLQNELEKPKHNISRFI